MDNCFTPFRPDPTFRSYRRNLPHWEQPGATYFITFRTADSLPQGRLRSLREQRDLWVKLHPYPWSFNEYQEYTSHLFASLDSYLDNGYGLCSLRQPEVSQIFVDSILHFDGIRYCLDEYVVMPNHVHLLVLLQANYSLERILHSWKSFTAGAINRYLGTKGTFWLDESFDRIGRTWEDLEDYRSYIRANPVKARLTSSEYVLGKGSGICRR